MTTVKAGKYFFKMNPATSIPASIIRKTKLTSEIFSLWVKPENSGPAPAPGQFYGIKPPDNADLLLRRPISVADTKNGKLRFIIRIAGKGTAALVRLPAGAKIDILGPLGRPAPLVYNKNVLLCGGGVGIAPLFYLARILAPSNRITTIIGARRAEDLILVKDFRALGARVLISTEDGKRGIKGVLTDLVPRILDKIPEPVIYTCGPREMLKKIDEIAGNLPVWGFLEERMGCGTGICYCCGIRKKTGGYLRICREGPVVNLKEVDL
ncbi:MAG: dihydroorotate dehydrogenase electron transfer subunit [candidate division WOR-3 bacterium]